MRSKFSMVYSWTVESDNIRLIVYRRYNDIRDQMSDDPRPEWQGTDEYKVEITELKVEYEQVEIKSGGSIQWRRENKGREIAFTGDINFVDILRVTAEKCDNFDTVVLVANVLNSREEEQ